MMILPWLRYGAQWWHVNHLSQKEKHKVHEIVMDGHEKIAVKCSDVPPAHASRPKKTGSIKMCNNGWLMVVDPRTGLILTIHKMVNPEKNDVAFSATKQTLSLMPNIDCVVYDRACILPRAAKVADLAGNLAFCAMLQVHVCPTGNAPSGQPQALA